MAKQKKTTPNSPHLRHLWQTTHKTNNPETNFTRYPKSNSTIPRCPSDRCLRTLQHAYEEVGAENGGDVKVAMPIVAKHFAIEAREHCYHTPKNSYNYYLNTPITALTSQQPSPTKKTLA